MKQQAASIEQRAASTQEAPVKPLIETLIDWEDADVAAYELGVVLGLFPLSSFLKHKWIFWTNNPLGNELHGTLMRLVALEVLQYDEEDLRFRWNQGFSPGLTPTKER